jgi:hypothetical protein
MRAAAIGAAVLALSACQGSTPAVIGEPIEMGPYTFSVVSAKPGKQWESSEGTYREIVVRVRVHRDDTAPFTENFSSSFTDKIAIEDPAGNSIGTTPAPEQPVQKAGRSRSEYYTCVFRYSRSSEGVRDFARIGTRPEEFRLLVTNPSRQRGQPRRVVVPLG